MDRMVLEATRGVKVAGRDWRGLAAMLAAQAMGAQAGMRENDVQVRGGGGYGGCGTESCMPPVGCFPPNNPGGGYGGGPNCMPGGFRQNYVGGVSLALAAATAVDVTITLRQEFKGIALIIPAAIASALVVNSVKIGNIEQLGGGAIPGFVFSSEQPNGGVLTMDYAPTSQVIITNVTNNSLAAVDVRLAFLGWTRM